MQCNAMQCNAMQRNTMPCNEIDIGSCILARCEGDYDLVAKGQYCHEDSDFDPTAGTGLCETEDVTGLEEGDYYRISTTLDDGTDFFQSVAEADGARAVVRRE